MGFSMKTYFMDHYSDVWLSTVCLNIACSAFMHFVFRASERALDSTYRFLETPLNIAKTAAMTQQLRFKFDLGIWSLQSTFLSEYQTPTVSDSFRRKKSEKSHVL